MKGRREGKRGGNGGRGGAGEGVGGGCGGVGWVMGKMELWGGVEGARYGIHTH
jgi:hypothetical protein